VASGKLHNIWVTDRGEVYSIGIRRYGNLGTGGNAGQQPDLQIEGASLARVPLPPDVNIVRAECGDFHTVCLSDKGEIFAFGRNDSGQLGVGDTTNRPLPVRARPLRENTRVVSVGGGHDFSVVSDSFGGVWWAGRRPWLDERSQEVHSSVFVEVAVSCHSQSQSPLASESIASGSPSLAASGGGGGEGGVHKGES